MKIVIGIGAKGKRVNDNRPWRRSKSTAWGMEKTKRAKLAQRIAAQREREEKADA